MKLIVKLPKGKPPFLGILFELGEPSDKLNQDLVLEHKYADYRVELEFIRSHINLKLISNSIPTVRVYSKLSYDKDKLKAWFYITKGIIQFNFGHVVDNKGKDVLVKTALKMKNFVLKIDSYKIFSENIDDLDITKETYISYQSEKYRRIDGTIS